MTSESPNPYASPAILDPQIKDASILFTRGDLATRWQRFLGALIDGLIGMPLGVLAGFALGWFLPVFGFEVGSIPFRIAAQIIGTCIGAAIFIGLHGYLLATRGQTIGKYFLKTQIVSDAGEMVPLLQLLLRRYLPIWFITPFPIVGPLFAIINALAIFGEQRKCFHDQIAETKVIQIE